MRACDPPAHRVDGRIVEQRGVGPDDVGRSARGPASTSCVSSARCTSSSMEVTGWLRSPARRPEVRAVEGAGQGSREAAAQQAGVDRPADRGLEGNDGAHRRAERLGDVVGPERPVRFSHQRDLGGREVVAEPGAGRRRSTPG